MNLSIKIGRKGTSFAHTFSICLFAMSLSCASKTPEKQPEPEIEKKVEQEMQCVSGCMPNDEDQCVIEARVSDGVEMETEIVECDPRCCEPGATFIGGGVDTDKDGIYDGADQCVNEAEDYDEYRDDDGCPDPDNDNDKILDVDDQCPLDPEDMNGVEDEDGCPD